MERERKREEKLRRREQRQRDREQRRSQKKLEKLQAEEQRQLQEKVRLEERRLLLAQRNLQSLRLLTELLGRAKVPAGSRPSGGASGGSPLVPHSPGLGRAGRGSPGKRNGLPPRVTPPGVWVPASFGSRLRSQGSSESVSPRSGLPGAGHAAWGRPDPGAREPPDRSSAGHAALRPPCSAARCTASTPVRPPGLALTLQASTPGGRGLNLVPGDAPRSLAAPPSSRARSGRSCRCRVDGAVWTSLWPRASARLLEARHSRSWARPRTHRRAQAAARSVRPARATP